MEDGQPSHSRALLIIFLTFLLAGGRLFTFFEGRHSGNPGNFFGVSTRGFVWILEAEWNIYYLRRRLIFFSHQPCPPRDFKFMADIQYL
jgi:hypothetical protein